MPKELKCWMVLFVTTKVVGELGALMPAASVAPVEVPFVPACMLLAVLLPMVLLLIVREADTADTVIPKTPDATAAVVPVAIQAPIWLLLMTKVPVEAELIPTIEPLETLTVATNAPVPVVAPIVLPAAVPMLALPAETLMPHNTPNPVETVLLVVKAMAVTVLPCMSLATPPAVKAAAMPTKRVAIVPVMV